MYRSYIDSNAYSTKENCVKPISPSPQMIARNDGTHMNPCKMKSSFIRQSFNFQNISPDLFRNAEKKIQTTNFQSMLNNKRQMRSSQNSFENPLQKIRKTQRRSGLESSRQESLQRSSSRQFGQKRQSSLSKQNSLLESVLIDNKSVEDSMTLILKRLAKNEYQIQKLQKQTLHSSNSKEVIANQLQKFREQIKRLIYVNIQSLNVKQSFALQEQVTSIKEQLNSIRRSINMNYDNRCNDLLKNQVQTIQNQMHLLKGVYSQVNQLENTLNLNWQKVQTNSQYMAKQLNEQLEKLAKIVNDKNCDFQTKINKIQEKLSQKQQQFCLFKRSNKICGEAIGISYSQLIKTKVLNNSLFSDRSKLLANAFNKQTELNNYHKTQKNNSLGSQEFSELILPTKQEFYYIDQEGYLLDKEFYYLSDQNDDQIKVQENVLGLLKSNGILV